MNMERLAARVFVVLGGAIWTCAFFGAPFAYRDAGLIASAQAALAPLLLTVAVFAIGLYFEYLAATVLGLAAVGVVAWGLTAGWEPGVWAIAGSFLLGPLAVAALLFLLAARMQTICALEEAEASRDVA
jgi:hypothetical protein